jgi:hypothetical protein
MPHLTHTRAAKTPRGNTFDFTTSSREGHLLWSGLRLGEAHAVRRTSMLSRCFGKLYLKSPK